MKNDSLESFAHEIHSSFGPLDSQLVERARDALHQLLTAPAEERWLRSLIDDAPDSRELYRDPSSDCLLLAHTEQAGLYRPPHDHGRAWVIYAVLRGEMEMGTYRRLHDSRGNSLLVRRERFALRPGDIRVFLPGDIHDTRCVAGPLTLFRFTSRDLKKEEVTRYPEPSDIRRALDLARAV